MNLQEENKALKERIAELEELAKGGQWLPQERLYYAKSKLTGQYLGDMASDEEWLYTPRWVVDKRDLHVEKLTKAEFKKIYGLDDTNADFEEVE